MPVRRSTDPLYVQYIWDSIKNLHHQKQVPDNTRLLKSIQKLANCSQTQAELYVSQALVDELIVEVRKIAQKGSNVGNEVESYKINKQEHYLSPHDDGYDWYCIECHLAGDVTLCSKCYRVFHDDCSKKASRRHMMTIKPLNTTASFATPTTPSVAPTATPVTTPTPEPAPTLTTPPEIVKNGNETNENGADDSVVIAAVEESEDQVKKSEESESTVETIIANAKSPADYIYDESLCCICNQTACDPGSGLDIKEFNYLLNFILYRIKSWVPEHLTNTINQIPKYEWHTPQELSWRAGQLLYQHMDMAAVELKIRTNDYTNFTQFQADVLTMVHNIAIFHGVDSQEYGAAELMLRDMRYDISEVLNCVDCYKHSNEKVNGKWFCLPCRIPHRLVWAKQKGYPYWPAKVIRETDLQYDVRFFGGKYERSVLPRNCIKPIETSMSQLQVKKTATFNKAMEELKLHQKLLDDPGEAEKLKELVLNKPKLVSKKTPSKPKRSLVDDPLSPFKKVQKKSSSSSKSLSPKKSSSSSMSEDIYEFHDSPTDVINGKDGGERSNKNKRKHSYNLEDGPESKSRKTNQSPKGGNSTPKAKEGSATDVINVSDNADTDLEFSKNEASDPSQNLVSSSTELLRDDSYSSRELTEEMQKLDQQYCDAVEKTRRKMELCNSKKHLITTAMDCMQTEVDRIVNEHNDTLKRLFDAHNTQISETKKKQWCFNCEQDAIYHCCWNTAYCSPTCQQQHWQAEHKKVCRRKR